MSKDQNNKQQQVEKNSARNSIKLVKKHYITSIANLCHGLWLEFQRWEDLTLCSKGGKN